MGAAAVIDNNPIIAPSPTGYQDWIVTLPRGVAIANTTSEEKAVYVWRNSGATSARPARVSDLPMIYKATAAARESWGKLD